MLENVVQVGHWVIREVLNCEVNLTGEARIINRKYNTSECSEHLLCPATVSTALCDFLIPSSAQPYDAWHVTTPTL